MKKPNSFQKQHAVNALKTVAHRRGRRLEEIRKEIDLAIVEAMKSTDPDVQARWKEIPSAGEVPTAEEVMLYVEAQRAGRQKR